MTCCLYELWGVVISFLAYLDLFGSSHSRTTIFFCPQHRSFTCPETSRRITAVFVAPILSEAVKDEPPAVGFMGYISIDSIAGWWFQISFYFPFHIWDVILPIDELHHFSR